ncbi:MULTISPECIES: hypothetical protein [unclassified Streptomyces]|uniref:hypothetical protein n=1 Tax=unclassified Streptomyces TaxID=2593676 RepID=UPI0004C4771A
MKRILNTAAATALALLLVTAGAAPAPAASYKYGRENACGSGGKGLGCNPGIVVKHWHKAGAKARGVGWVYASTNETAGKRKYHARWLYQRPGGKLAAATGWKRAKRFSDDATFVETSWGKDGRTGPQYPVNTKICVQIKETGKKACVRLR